MKFKKKHKKPLPKKEAMAQNKVEEKPKKIIKKPIANNRLLEIIGR